MTFGLAAAFLWLGFFAMNFGWPAKLAERAAYFSPYYVSDIDPIPMAVALLFTPVWLFAITRKRIRGRQAVTNWAAGATLVWALMMTLFLPWLDAAKSYKPVVEQMLAAAPAEVTHGSACIAVADQERDARLAWAQYSDVRLLADSQSSSCRYRLVKIHDKDAPTAGWQTLWQGNRPRSKGVVFALQRRI